VENTLVAFEWECLNTPDLCPGHDRLDDFEEEGAKFQNLAPLS
jgi:hypothetical protein